MAPELLPQFMTETRRLPVEGQADHRNERQKEEHRVIHQFPGDGERGRADHLEPELPHGAACHVEQLHDPPAIQRALREVAGAFDAVASLGGESFLVYALTGGRITNALSDNKCAAGSGMNTSTTQKFPRSVLPGTFDYGAKVSTMVKDIALGLKEAETLGVPMWVHETVGQLWRFGVTQGLGEADITSLIQVLEGWGGAKVRGR